MAVPVRGHVLVGKLSATGVRPEGEALSPFVAGLRCRCPRCGEGRLFSGYLDVAERCGSCGLELRAYDSGDGPAVIIIFLLGLLVVPLALLVESIAAPPYWVHLVVWPPVILGLALGLLRPIKAFFVAQQYRHRPTSTAVS